MPYTQFKTLKQVKNDFDLTIVENTNFIPKLEPTSASSVLSAFLERTLPSVIASSSEKVRSEGIVYPVLIEVRELLDRVVNVFSGEDFTVDESRGLNGVCDFLISASPEQVEIEAPVLLIVEAKRDNIKSGLGQCIAQMVAAQKLNTDEKTNILTVYGSVTTGTAWRFLKLEGKTINIELFDYPLPPVEKILSILLWMIKDSQQQPLDAIATFINEIAEPPQA
ncbi:MAG: hypothetical protein SAL70_13790 [Scytonema sp. PMC 1070.18]|nr:hypothetical protein [Scytonema sp. PMC 1070.18]